MPDRSISDLTEATLLTSTDLFVLQQNNVAKKLTGQSLLNNLATALDAHGGISSITKTSTSGLTDNYRISYADGTYTDFTIVNGKGISSIEKISTVGLKDTYRITLNDASTFNFEVNNGRSISSISKTGTSGLVDTYTISYNNSTSSTFTVTNGAKGDTGSTWYTHIRYSAVSPTKDSDVKTTPDNYIGIYSGTSSTAPTAYTSYSWFQYKGNKGDTGNGITGITGPVRSGLSDTYTILYDSGSSRTFVVTNGASISGITKTGTSGLTDTYSIAYTDSRPATTFTVANGKGITSIALVSGDHSPGTTDTYRINYNDGTYGSFTVYNGANGTGAVSTLNGIQPTGSDLLLFKYGTSAPTSDTVGVTNQIFIDTVGREMYLCRGQATGGGYNWLKVSSAVIVDSTLDSTSTNPVQNKVIAAAIVGKVNTSDIVDNLTSIDSSKVLSAKQGKELKALVDAASATAASAASDASDALEAASDAQSVAEGLADTVDELSEIVDGKADSSDLTTHTGNTDIHVTAEDKTTWDGKADASTVSSLSSRVGALETDIEGKAEASALSAHTGNSDIHVTAVDKAAWDAKADASDVSSLSSRVGTLETQQTTTSGNLSAHTGNSAIHVTASDKASWNAKASGFKGTIEVPVSGWSNSAPYSKTLTISGVLATDDVMIDFYPQKPDSATTWSMSDGLAAYMNVSYNNSAANSLTLYCLDDKPTHPFMIQYKVVRV